MTEAYQIVDALVSSGIARTRPEAYRMAAAKMGLRASRGPDVVREYVNRRLGARAVTMRDGSKQSFPQLVLAADLRAMRMSPTANAAIKQARELEARILAKRDELLRKGKHPSITQLYHLVMTPKEAEQFGACRCSSSAEYRAWRARLKKEFAKG